MDYYLIGGVICGILGIVALLWISIYFARSKPSLAEGVVVFITAAGLSAGVKVCVLSLNPEVLTEVENERIYVFLGGLAVIWVSIDTLWSTLSDIYQRKRSLADRDPADSDKP
uniref:Uncharacterized protein n=1 Tax=Candidatus Kentrum sp. FW TaxID=2126338 RepID=A0A450S6A5_9GAMM|nr:MAG: hypothetical protein BECKFW1821A_GA0114235_101622 [Candidatus Kentron sp. FW]